MDDLLSATIAKISEERVVNLTRSLVDIPSATGEERRVAEFLVGYMKEIGLEAKLQEIVEGRANAIGVLKGTGGGPTLMFNGHLDTSGTSPLFPRGPPVDPCDCRHWGRLEKC